MLGQGDANGKSAQAWLYARAALIALAGLVLAGCVGTPETGIGNGKAHINTKTKFSVADYGVSASPRMTTAKRPKKGGGRAFVGKPYRVRGKWYTPKEESGYDRAGLASWYGPNFHGRLTANGEIYDQFHLSAAHPTFPLPSYARVTNKKNGNSVIVRVNDRGPFAHGRIIDLSNKAAQLLDMKQEGVAAVRVQYVGRAPVEGDDTSYLVASYRPGGSKAPAEGTIASGVMLAMNSETPALPGVASAAAGLAPPAAVGAVTGAVPALNSGFVDGSGGTIVLPQIGPLAPERPSFATPVADSGMPATPRNVGLAYWGNRPGSPDAVDAPFARLFKTASN